MQEHKIIAGCLQQDRVSQKALYDTYSRQMYPICLRYHKDKDLANESLQRGFIKVFKRLESYSGAGSLGGWIRRIIVTTAIDVLKEQQKLQFEEVETLDHYATFSEDSSSRYQEIDYNAMLRLLDRLPIGYKTVFSMYVLDGLKHDEIASNLGISISTSRSQLFKSKKMMKALIIKEFDNITLENK